MTRTKAYEQIDVTSRACLTPGKRAEHADALDAMALGNPPDLIRSARREDAPLAHTLTHTLRFSSSLAHCPNQS